MRAGTYVNQPAGYRAFIPAPLPPDPPVHIDDLLSRQLSDADRALGRLDGVSSVLPSPDLFVAMYVRQEAVLSSQIEGTQSTLEDVLEYEAGAAGEHPPDAADVVNYVAAMNHGLQRLPSLPLSLRLICEIHGKLLQNVRGGEWEPGQFRRSQNWVGPGGCTLNEATFIPPPPHEMQEALHNLEHFMHHQASLPVLIHCGLIHAQFETIHPFLDGNGRVGRLLITLLLCEQRVLQRPLLYLSYYLKLHRAQYYDRLMAVRNDGDWEGWLKFFLRGVGQTSRAATETARAILTMREAHRKEISGASSATTYPLQLLDYLFQQPIVSARMVESRLGCAYATAAKAVAQLQDLDLLEEISGRQRGKLYRYGKYIDLFERQTMPEEPPLASP